MTSLELIQAYNRLVALMVEGRFRPGYGRRGGFLSFNQHNLALAEQFVAWCGDQSFHPPMYLAGAFGKHNWCYQPRFAKLREKRYQEAYSDGTAEQWWAVVERMLDAVKPAPDLHPAQEMLKRRYKFERKVWLCESDRDVTGGFNPKSPVCAECPLRGACRG